MEIAFVAFMALLLVNTLIVVLRFGQLRRRLKVVDPEFHDAVYEWAYWPISNPPESMPFQQFIRQREYERHADEIVRLHGAQLRSAVVRSIMLFVLTFGTGMIISLS